MTTTLYPAEATPDQSPDIAPTLAISNWIISIALSATAVTIVALQVEAPFWIYVPLFFCGVLTAVDAVAWLRRQLDLFDPVGITGLFGVHFFFIAPLLHLVWNEWLAYVKPLSDWPEWLGWMAVINSAGLVLYRATRSWAFKRKPRTDSGYRTITEGFFPLLAVALAITFIAQILVYWSFGGVIGYINAFQHEQRQFISMGWVFMISESFPILLFMGYAVFNAQRGRVPSWFEFGVVLLLFIGVVLLFGGLRGSRMNTLWGVIWAAGIFHFLVRPIPRSTMYIGCIGILLFLYVYGFYKARGLSGLEAIGDVGARDKIQRTYHRTFDALILGDLGRADVQAFVLHQTCSPQSTYQWAWGRTYLGTAAMLVPKAVVENRPLDKVYFGTQALFPGQSKMRASNVYGIAGEGMLNFGPVGAFLSFAAVGVFVGMVRGWAGRVGLRDARWLVLPFVISLCPSLIMSDSDNVLFILVKQGAVPFLIAYLGSRASSISFQPSEMGH